MPGEKLSDFAARVDRAIPVAGLKRKSSQAKDADLGLKARRTKHERRLQRMQNEWREEDRRRKEKEAELRDEMEDNDGYDIESQWQTVKKGRRRGTREDDPWRAIKASRGDTQKSLQDVVQAPPQLANPKEKPKLYAGAKVDVAGIPGRAGSLRKREELASARKSIVEQYRQIMANRGGNDG